MRSFILLALFTVLFCAECGTEIPKSESVCHKETTNPDSYCCYAYGLARTSLAGGFYYRTVCESIPKKNIDNDAIFDYMKLIENDFTSGWKNYNILDCKSSFLKIGFLSILALLF